MFPLPLVVAVAPSRRLRLAVAGLHAAAVGALWLADLSAAAQLAGTALVAAGLAVRLRPERPVTLRARARGELEIRSGEVWSPLAAYDAQLLLPGLTLLRYRLAGARRSATLAILPDSLPPEDFRRLRTWLRWLGEGRTKPCEDAGPPPA